MIRRFLISILLLVSLINHTFSQKVGQDSISSVLIEEVNVNAPLFISSKQDWPGGYMVADSLQIQSGNGYLLSEQLNTVPGVFMQQGTLSTNRITIRGIGSRTPYNSNRIKAYWGDVPLTDGDGVTSIEDFGLNDISSIQILKGPASALYGSGLGGVVVLLPNDLSTSESKILFKSEVGSFATFLQQVNYNVFNKKKIDLDLNVNHLTSGGYRQNSNYKRTNVTLRGRYKIGGSSFNVLYNYRFLNGQIPSSLDSLNFYNNPDKAAYSWAQIKGFEKSNKHLLSLGWGIPLNNKLANSVNVFTHISSLDELRPFNRLEETRSSIGIREKLVYKNGTNKLITGFELMREINGLSYYSVDDSNDNALLNSNDLVRSYINVFVIYEKLIFKKLLLQASCNLNRAQYESKADQDQYVFDWIASPRLGLNYAINKEHNLLGSAGHGFSTPSFEEAQMPDGSFNKQIKPEEGWGYEIGYRYTQQKQQLSFDMSLYALNMKNLLVTKRETEEIFYGINAGKTKHYGIESSLMYYIIPKNSHRYLYINANYFTSHNEFIQFVDDGNNQSGNQLPGIPKYVLSLDLNTFIRPLSFNLSYKSIGNQYLTDDNSISYAAYQKVDLKVKVALNISRIKSSFYLGCNNLFDEHYASMVLINASAFGTNKPRYYYPGQPLNFYGGIEINW